MAPGLDQVLDEKRYKGRLSSGYPSDDILESRYGGRISPPPRRHYESPSEYQHTDSGYPSTSPVCKQLVSLISFYSEAQPPNVFMHLVATCIFKH